MKARPSRYKAMGLLLALEKKNPNYPQELEYKLSTGRLPLKAEWDIMKTLGTSKLSDTYSAIAQGKNLGSSATSAPLNELIKKGYIKKPEENLAKRLLKHLQR